MRNVKLILVFILLALLLSVIPAARAWELFSPPSPTYWISARADHWETVYVNGEEHKLAVWNEPYGFDPHFHGPGGDMVTCCSTHGCIWNWTWWLRYPQSKLGVPKSFLICGFFFDSQNISNYSATVWSN